MLTLLNANSTAITKARPLVPMTDSEESYLENGNNRVNPADHDILIRQTVMLENIEKDLKEIKEETSQKYKDLERRTDDLEDWKLKVIGFGLGAGAVGGFLAKILFK